MMQRPAAAARPRGRGRHDPAVVFAALGDETRLTLIGKLSAGEPRSISQLATGSALTRQAITKHLRVLQGAMIVHGARSGREIRFALRPEPLIEAGAYLQRVSAQWDDALARLKALVEKRP
jgi:DNA-binding transcriptional ArsR family regulator